MNKNFVGKIEKVKWNSKKQSLIISGYCFIDGIDIETEEKVKKSLIISNDSKSYVVKAKNTLRHDVTESFGLEKNNYDYSGFSCVVDVGFIDRMKPLDEGSWNVDIYLNVSGVEYRGDIKLMLDEDTEDSEEEVNRIWRFGFNDIVEIEEVDSSLKIISRKDRSISVSKAKREKRIKKIVTKIKKKQKKCSENIGLSLYKLFCLFPLKEDRVTFLTDSRGGLYGNFRFVNDELKARGVEDIKYMLKPHDNMKKTPIEKIKVIWYIATSGAILLDDYYPFLYNIKPRKETKLVQLWHAPGAFKTFGFSRVGKLGWSKNPRAKNHRTYTHAIVSSTPLKSRYAEAYAIPEQNVYATGIPRTDVFFDEVYKENKIRELYEKYPILKGKKVIMFAPTFRGKGRGGYYDFDKLDLDRLKEALGDEYVFIMKLHPFISNKPEFDEKYNDFMIDLSHENEINDLLFVSDVMITDYSSVCFEFSLLNRPMIFFAYDMEDYIAKRDFYYPYESFVPGPIVNSTEEIIDIILKQEYELEKLNDFRNRFFDHFDGKSTERVVDMILDR